MWPPSGVNLTALVARLETIRSRCSSSPSTTTGSCGTSTSSCWPRSVASTCTCWPGAADHLAQVDRLLAQLHVERLEAGEREQVVDQLEQPVAVGVDPAECLVLGIRGVAVRPVDEELEVADDVGDRGAQLVADAGDEGVLGAVDLGEVRDRAALGLQRSLEGALRTDPLGDVLGRAEVADDGAVLVGHLRERHRHRADLAVLADVAPVPRADLGACAEQGDVTEGRGYAEGGGLLGDLLRGVEHVGPLAEQLLLGVAEQGLRPGVEQGDAGRGWSVSMMAMPVRPGDDAAAGARAR